MNTPDELAFPNPAEPSQEAYCYPRDRVSGEIDWEAFRDDAEKISILGTMTWPQLYMAAFFDFLDMEARAERAEQQLAQVSPPALPAPVPFLTSRPIPANRVLRSTRPAKHEERKAMLVPFGSADLVAASSLACTPRFYPTRA
jgi:hypothetical protein